jgi:hypothetical protein
MKRHVSGSIALPSVILLAGSAAAPIVAKPVARGDKTQKAPPSPPAKERKYKGG